MPPALTLDLLASVLAAGAPPRGALLELAAALEAAGDAATGEALRATAERMLVPHAVPAMHAIRPVRSARKRSGNEPNRLIEATARALALAQRAGLPPAELLRAAAQRERTRESAAARAAVRRLEVMLVLPAGLCLLPAFILLGVAPVVIALLHG